MWVNSGISCQCGGSLTAEFTTRDYYNKSLTSSTLLSTYYNYIGFFPVICRAQYSGAIYKQGDNY